MSKKLLIIIGSVSIILLLGAWVYLFVFGTPDSVGQALSNLNSPSTPYEQPIVSNPTSTLPVGSTDLSQLSTRYVAGFTVENNSENPSVRYVEKGTGHIYEINTGNGTEERIDGTTIAGTVEAYFDPTGETVILVSYSNNERKVNWRTAIGQASNATLPADSYDFTWDQDGNLFYAVKTPGLTIAYKNTSGNDTELWRVPLSDIRVLFTENGDYVVNNPAPRLAGGVYEVKNNQLVSVTDSKYAFTATAGSLGELFLYRYFDTEEQVAVSKALDTSTGQELRSSLASVPEKCAFDEVNYRVWCASSFSFSSGDREYLNKWYRGEVTSPDKLWVSSYNDLGSATLAVDLSEEAGFYIDVTDLKISADGNILLFRNKTNDALWMYRVNERDAGLETPEETTATSSDDV